MRRVVVTGMGAVSPLGNTAEGSWEALVAGRPGLGPLRRFPAEGLPWGSAGELKGFDAGRYVSRKDALRLDDFVLYGYAAARMAALDAGLGAEVLGGAGVLIGTSRGGVGSLEAAMAGRPSAHLMSSSTAGAAASYCARMLGARGHVMGISNACASGSNAIGEAFRLIRHGHLHVALAGGAEAPLCSLCMRGYGVSGALSRKGQSRPFDRARDGFVLAEGAAVLVLEEMEGALARGARIYGAVLGYGNTSDAHHPTAPSPGGQAAAMRAALREAGLAPGDVGFVMAHATATPLGDRAEARAIGLVFPGGAAVSAPKSMTGHMLGASGAFEAAMALRALGEGLIPPTIGIEEPDVDLDIVRGPRRTDAKAAMTNSFGFGGVNSVLALGRPDDA